MPEVVGQLVDDVGIASAADPRLDFLNRQGKPTPAALCWSGRQRQGLVCHQGTITWPGLPLDHRQEDPVGLAGLLYGIGTAGQAATIHAGGGNAIGKLGIDDAMA